MSFQKVFRVLLGMFTQGLFENTSVPRSNYGRILKNVSSPAHNAMARELAASGAVLVQNDLSVLPLDLRELSTVVVVGAAASVDAGAPAEGGEPPNWPVTGGGGSGSVMPPYRISVLEAVRARMAAAGHPPGAVLFHNGSDPEAAAALAATADAAIIVVAVSSSEGSDRMDLMLPPEQSNYVQAVGKAQPASAVIAITPGALLTLHCPPPPPPPPPPKLKGCTVDRDMDYFNAPCADSGCGKPAKTLQECCDQCRQIPSCHAFTWTGACPGCSPATFCWHKKSAIGRTAHKLLLSGNCTARGDADESGDSDAIDNTQPANIASAQACVDWATDVAALLVMFMPGQEEGNAAADILFGDTSPSGRLPLTFPSSRNQVNMTKEMYPGVIDPKDGVLKAQYSERLEVGYRFYAAHPNVTSKFAFGHGLS